MKKKFLLIILACGLVVFLLGMKMYNKAPDNISSMKTDFQINAAELLSAFENDETAANLKFLDKVVEVNGVVEKHEMKEGKLTAYLSTDNPLSNVIFQFENQNEQIETGENITLKGICTGYLMDVVVVRTKKI